MGGIGIILNQNAGKRQPFRGHIGEKLAFVLGDPQSLCATSRVEQIGDVARAFRQKDIDILGISGGDGSNHYVITTFIDLYGEHPLPRVAFLCGGTHNAHAASLGIQGSPEKLLDQIVRKYHTGERFSLAQRKTLKVNDGKAVRYGFTMATGFMFRFYQELHVHQDDTPWKVAKHLSSWAGSALIGGRWIREMFRREPVRITVGEQRLPWDEYNGMACSTMERIGLGLTPFPRANENPRMFHMSAFRMKPTAFVGIIWSIKRGIIPRHPDQHTDITERIVLEAEEPISYVLDGELYHGTPRLEIQTGPTIEVILP